MDKQIESSDNKIDESNLSGIEPLDDEAGVLITEIQEHITSEEEMNEIAFPNNNTEESWRDVELDESIDFDWKKILHKMQNFKTYAELKEFVFEKEPLLPPPSVKMKYYMDSHDEICKVANNFQLKGMPENFVPVLTIGDGNCLPHSLANVLLGDQGRSDEVRVRITFNAVHHEEKSITHLSLSRGCPRGTPNRHHSYTLYSGNALADCSEVNDTVVCDVYHADVLTISKDGNYMGIWQFHHTAEAFK